ncbi:hypothetical protein HanIR_Chr02g0062341 [Helianthus annuus]|nr:hypothetical protein HanIR_Chr02g0062341 [Helianthus annuus]
MVLTNFNGTGIGFGFGAGCGFGVGWGFGGMPLNFLGLGAAILTLKEPSRCCFNSF